MVQRYLRYVATLASEHEFPLLLILLLRARRRSRPTTHSGAVFLEFLDAVPVSERVERVLAARGGGRHVGDHSGFAVASEGVLEHLRQLAATEGQVLLLEVESSDTLLECEQGLIDLGAVQSRLPVLVDGVGAALATCQINEAHLSKLTVRIGLRPELELEDGVGA